jgi:hypothetical protein
MSSYTVNIENLGIGDARVINQQAQHGKWNPYLRGEIQSQGVKDSGMVQAYSGPIQATFEITLVDVDICFECTMSFEAAVSSPAFSYKQTRQGHGTTPKGYTLKYEAPFYKGSAATVNVHIVGPACKNNYIALIWSKFCDIKYTLEFNKNVKLYILLSLALMYMYIA